MVINNANTQLSNQVKGGVSRAKYFPIELFCKGLLPNTTYDAYANGILINSFCKPYGNTLGGALRSNSSGTLRIQYHMQVQYNQQYISQPSVGNNNLIQTGVTINLVDPFGHSSIATIPLTLKSGS